MKIIRDNVDIFSEYIFHNYNDSIFAANFPSELKNVDVTPVFAKKYRNNIQSYCPGSILPNLSKIYESCLYDQIHKYFNSILPVLSKTFNLILYKILIVKLATHGFGYQSFRIIEGCITNRQQGTKTNNALSRYSEILYWVTQGSILGPLIFNIYVCDIIYDIIECDIASYADDNTSYSFNFSLDNVINNLEKSTGLEKTMKTNADKYNILMSSDESSTAKIKDFYYYK